MTSSIEQLQAQIDDLRTIVGDLQDREAIRRCLTSYARGVDRFDRELIMSAFHPDAIDDHGKFIGGPNEFVDWALNQHGKAHMSHQHCLFNHRCDIEGNTAHSETYFMFVAMNRQGPPYVVNGGRYLDRFEKRDGVWAIAYRTVTRDWGLLDYRPDIDEPSSFTSTRLLLTDEIRDFLNTSPGPKRDATDLSYNRPLELDPKRQKAWNDLQH